MSSSSSMLFKQRVSLFAVAAIFAAASVGAQSTVSPNESSSSSFQLAANDGLNLGIHPAMAVEGAGGVRPAGNWRQYAASNFAFEAGGGFNGPIGNDTSTGGGGPFITWGGNFTVGGGLHLSKRISLLAEYQFIDDKLPGNLIAQVGTQGGNAHIWSLTLDPVIDLFPKHANSVYVTGGGGFYRKLTSFTEPVEGVVCTYYCGIVVENQTVFHFSSNQGGASLGLGFTRQLRGFSGEGKAKLFAEARYLFVNTPSINSTNGTGTTGLIPITLGVRF